MERLSKIKPRQNAKFNLDRVSVNSPNTGIINDRSMIGKIHEAFNEFKHYGAYHCLL